jgi:hypothetical protein
MTSAVGAAARRGAAGTTMREDGIAALCDALKSNTTVKLVDLERE